MQKDSSRRRFPLADRIIELELALLAQLHDAGGREALRVRRDTEAMARRQALAFVQVGVAKRLVEHDAAAVGDGDHAAGLLGHPHLEFEPARDVVERR